jgi:hypothetical protein
MSPDLTKSIDRDPIVLMGFANSVPRCDRLERGQRCNPSRNDGVSNWSTGVSVAESPLVPGILWVGTDDGNIQVSKDGGATWTEVSRNLPGGTTQYYVSRVEASYFDPATAYVSIDGHKSDDLRPYVYVTEDYGRSWQSIASNLPELGNVNTVRQDRRNPDLLYAGTEFGFFVSRDEGASWQPFMNGLPVVRIDDVLVHPRDNDLVLATHGRSIYVMDDITALQALTPEVASSDVHLFQPREAVLWRDDRRRSRSLTGDKNWTGESALEGTALSYWLASGGDVTITVEDPLSGEVFRTLEAEGAAGLNRTHWDLRGDPPAEAEGGGGGGFGGGNQGPSAEPGVYRVQLSVNGRDYHTSVRVLEDVGLGALSATEGS